MTRINYGIPPKFLTDRHLLAEHREIKRIPNHLEKHGHRSLDNKPKNFTLGTGHVKFFLAQGKYTFERYLMIHAECKLRGFNVEDYSGAWDVYKRREYQIFYHDCKPQKRDVWKIMERLVERDIQNYSLLWPKLLAHYKW